MQIPVLVNPSGWSIVAKNRILALTATGTGLNTGNTGLATGLLAKSNRKFHPVLVILN